MPDRNSSSPERIWKSSSRHFRFPPPDKSLRPCFFSMRPASAPRIFRFGAWGDSDLRMISSTDVDGKWTRRRLNTDGSRKNRKRISSCAAAGVELLGLPMGGAPLAQRRTGVCPLLAISILGGARGTIGAWRKLDPKIPASEKFRGSSVSLFQRKPPLQKSRSCLCAES